MALFQEKQIKLNWQTISWGETNLVKRKLFKLYTANFNWLLN